ncbi:MAG: chromate transporter, partial [Rhodospirillales bacterium]|nr:chromate transporter [Rhodospirillales bacterium]
QAVLRVGGRALRNPVMIGLAVAAFVALFLFSVPFPVVVVAAGLIGFLGARAGSSLFAAGGGHGGGAKNAVADADSLLGARVPDHARPDGRRSIRVALVWLALWLIPVAAILLAVGPSNVFGRIAIFFSQMAVVTFGGAYAVLAYVAQAAVETYGWLKPGEMLDGLGMAETTPGPLIMVLQFVGFMGAFRDPGTMSPLLAGTLGGLLATWVTFAPCFLWIFAGAPYVEAVRGNKALSGALAAITAAVVGVIANLAAWFALNTLFARLDTLRWGPLTLDVPALASVNWAALGLTIVAMILAFGLKLGMTWVLAVCAAAGVALRLAGVV